MPITLATGLIGGGLGANVLGGIFGAGKRRRAAEALVRREKKRLGELETAGAEYKDQVESTLKGAYADLTKMPELDIDTAAQDAAYANAQRASEYAFGRSAGEEIAKDEARQSTADAIARARQSGSSVADILGFTAQAEGRERAQIRDIDAQSMAMREQRIAQAMDRLESAGAQRAGFYERKQMAEFQADTSRSMALADFKRNAGMTLADINMQNQMSLIDARDRIAAAKAGKLNMQASNTQAIFQGLGQGAMDFGFMKYQNDYLNDLVVSRAGGD